MTIIEAIALGEMTVKNTTSQQKYYETADDTVFICPRCKIAWEKTNGKKDKQKIYYSRGIVPSYRKKRRICPFCKKRK